MIGGGQEIHTGEAGLSEWGNALQTHSPGWKIAASPNAIRGDESGTKLKLFVGETPKHLAVMIDDDLHLDDPTRQFRGKSVARWVEHVLACDSVSASAILQELSKYEICLTRNLDLAKGWLQAHARGSERYGLMASSGAKRLRAFGITVPGAGAEDVEHWFLAPNGDVRSAFQLEVAATEFQAQGLEIDWVCVCWGGDFLTTDATTPHWQLKEFSGSRWMNVKSSIRRNYIENTYRVLLTRARQGMVIYVPEGYPEDPTTTPVGYDDTARFLVSCGVKNLDRI